MDRDGVREFLESIGARKIRNEPKWVMACCPLSPFVAEHKYRQEGNPSFGVSIQEEKISMFNCFTCGHKGPLYRLLEMLQEFTGDDFSEEIEAIKHNEMFGGVVQTGWTKGTPAHVDPEDRPPVPLDEDYEDLYDDCDPEHPYLAKRGIDPETCRRLQLKWDEADSDGDERILFPVRDAAGTLYGFTGRAVDRNVELRVRDYHGLRKKWMVLGIEHVQSADFVLVTEGLFDYARGQALGFPTVALLGAAVTDEKAAVLRKLGKPIYGFLDNDPAGRKATRQLANTLGRHVPVMRVKWKRRKGGKMPKDMGQLTKREIERMIDTAVILRPE